MLLSKIILSPFRGPGGETMSYKVSSTCLKFSFAALLLLFLQPVFGQKYDWNELDQAIQQKQKTLGKNFVVMVWKKDDTLVYKKEVGDYNTKTQAPIASCSKWLTAALVMIMVDEGKISLDDKITNWLPEFAKYGKNYITIRHCLSHMTGIQSDPITLMKLLQRKKYTSLEEEVNAFAAKEIQANPGEEFRYSEIGLNIAGRILEIVSKKRFDVLAQQKLFRPLGMRRTSFSNLEGGAINPSGGAVSTPDDYMRFLVMLMNKGVYNGQRIISEASINEMMTQQVTADKIKYAPKVAEGFTYALGSWVGEEKNGKATVLASPGLFGTWPMIDYCHGYAYLVFVKNLLDEDRANTHMELKKIIDEQIPSTCN
ncbi:MAG: beta-lactamase family protein [Bacteroidetes bacterium]|nr:beta-lactamase family protein [Bacteroidota bacterium]